MATKQRGATQAQLAFRTRLVNAAILKALIVTPVAK